MSYGDFLAALNHALSNVLIVLVAFVTVAFLVDFTMSHPIVIMLIAVCLTFSVTLWAQLLPEDDEEIDDE